MNPQSWYRLSAGVASAIALVLFSNICLVSGADAQTAASAAPGSTSSVNTRSPFVVAPSFPLAGAPAGVALGDLNQDGKLDLVTTDSVSGKVTVFLGLGNGKFASGVEYSIGSHPGAVAVGDIDGDGHLEVIVGDEVKGTISVLTASATGTLQLKQNLSAGIDPAFLATGDFNGNGRTDLAVAARSGGSLAVLLNDGKGNLQKPVLSTLLKAPNSLTVADFNNDGHADVALANADGTATILLGSGNGKFHAFPDISIAAGSLSSIVSGDFNRDGKADLAVTQSGNKTASVLIGNGDGTFEKATDYAVGNHPVFALVADLTGSGFTDLIAINQGSNTFSVLSGNGDGTFKNSVDFVVGKDPLAAVAGDFDADGHLDLAVINSSSQSVSVALGNGDGTFKASRSYSAGMQPRALASADLNGDKIPDLVVTNYCGSDSSCSKGGSVAVFLGNADHNYELANTYALGAGTVAVALVDVNGDKSPDIVALNREDKSVSILLGKGDGSFEQPITVSVAESPIAIAVGDFNKDGQPDLAVLGDCGAAKCTQPGSLEVLLGHGTGFTTSAVYPVGFSPTSLAVGDLKGDKNLDLVVSNSCGTDASCKSPGSATVLLGSATGKFTAAADAAVGNSPSSIALGDLSGRGVLDLLSASSSDNTVAVLAGKGDGTFAAPVAYKVGNSPGSIVIADFNGDAKPDVAVTNVQDSTVSVLFGRGDGSLFSAVALPVGMGPDALTAVSGTGGGHASLATANGNSGSATQGTDITLLSNPQPLGGGATATTIGPITLMTGANDSPYGTQLVFLATVTGTAGATQPTGTVTFNDTSVGGSPSLSCSEGTASPLTQNSTTNSTATCTISSLTPGTHTIVGTYTPATTETTYAGSGPSTPALSQTVETVSPTVSVAITTGSSPIAYTSAVTFTATVPASAGLAVPTGTITFLLDSTTVLCNAVNLVGGAGISTAMCDLSTLPAGLQPFPGSHVISATYTPATTDTNYATATSTTPNSAALTVNRVAAAVSMSYAGPAQAAYGTSLTFTASLAGPGGALPGPTGTVTFLDGTNPISTCTSVSLPVATNPSVQCTVSTLTPGAHTIGATYTPASTDTNYLTATNPASSEDHVTVNPVPATISFISSPTLSTVDQTVVITATVVPTVSIPSVPPNGSVSFIINGSTTNPDCDTAVKVNASAQAVCTVGNLVVPTDVIAATYSGDTNYTVTGTQQATLSVSKANPVVSVSTTTPTSAVNQVVTFTATVKPATGVGLDSEILPGGSVTFTQGATSLCSSAGIIGSTASCVYTFTSAIPSPGVAITATYNGDPNFNSTPANTATPQIVGPSGTTTTIESSAPNPSNVGQSVTFTAFVGSQYSGTAVPTGNVVFTDTTTSTTMCTEPVASSGNVTACVYAFPSSGPQTVSATFTPTAGNTNFTASTSANFAQTVNASGTSVTLTVLPASPSTVDQSVVFSATVTSTTGAATAPQGSVAYTDTSTATTLCTVTLNATTGAVPNCSVSNLSAGTHPVVASFTTSNSNYQSASSAVLPYTVNPQSATLSLASSSTNKTSIVDSPVTFTATLTASQVSPLGATGVVNFTLNGNALCNAVPISPTATGGTATCMTSALVTPSGAIQASYSNDVNFKASPASLTQTVNPENATLALTSSATNNTAPVNTPIVFTATLTAATVTPIAPAGSVSFTVGGNPLPGCTSVAAPFNPATGTSTATCPSNALPENSTPYAIAATYTDTNKNFSASPGALNETVTAAAPTLVVSSSASPIVFRGSVTFTATLTGVPLTPVTPTTSTSPGTVTFTYTSSSIAGTTTLCSAAQITTAGTVTCTSSVANSNTLPAGSDNITAVYTGDANFAGAASAPFPESVGQTSAGSVTIQSSTASSSVNQQVTFTATVTASSGGPLPTGNVTFKQAGVATPVCGSQPLSPSPSNSTTTSTATCTYTFIQSSPSGSPFAIVATYNGNSTYGPTTSSSTPQTVTAETLSTSLTGPSNGAINQPLTYTATLAPTASGLSGSALPTAGTVTFFSALGSGPSNPISNCTLAVTGSFTYTCNIPSFLTTGTYTIRATYASASDPNFTCSGTACSASQQTIIGGAATYTASSGPSSGALNTSVNISTTVSSCPIPSSSSTCVPGNNAPLNGTITYTDSQVSGNLTGTGCSVTLTNATSPFTPPTACVVPLLSQGSHSITATFTPASAGNYNGSVSTPVAVSVAPVATATAIGTSVASPTVDAPVTFTAIVTPQYIAPPPLIANPTVPAGTVTVSYYPGTAPLTNQTVLTALCAPNAVNVISQPATPTTTTETTVTASCTEPILQEGSYTIVASFNSADTNFGSSKVTQTVMVQAAPTSITVAPPLGTTIVNQPVTFSATVSPTGISDSGRTVPTGLVSFLDTTTNTQICGTNGSAIQANGTVTCALYAFPTAGPHSIQVTYTSGDQNFTGGTLSPNLTFMVSQDTPKLVVTSSTSNNTSVATQTVTFTATVTPTYPGTGPTNPKAGITITPTAVTGSGVGVAPSCTTPTSASTNSGKDVQACSISFPGTTSGQFVVSAAYTGDSNFTAVSNPIPVTQTVQNFSLAVTPSAPVTLTQGYSNNGAQINGITTPKDPFTPVTIMVNSSPFSGYEDLLQITCTVQNSQGSTVTDPSCATSPATLVGAGGPIPVTISSTLATPLDQYSVVLTATDLTYSNLSQSSQPLLVDVVSQSGALSLAGGSSAASNVQFNTFGLASGTALTVGCGAVSVISAPAGTTPESSWFTCSGQGLSNGNVSTIPISITVVGTTSAPTASVARGPGSIAYAAFWGVPLLAVLAWFGHRKSPRRNFFRFLGMLLLIVGLSHTIGCGGSFNRGSLVYPVAPAGTYLVQVLATATDSSGNQHQYSAVVPVTVASTSN